MNGPFDRKLIAECVVLLAVCVGAWLMVVRPKLGELRELEARIAEAKTDPARESRQTVEQMASRLSQVRDEVRQIERQNALGRDSSQMLYGLIMELAKEHAVAISRLDPGTRASGAGENPVDVTSFSMNVAGKYRNVASFLDGITGIDGFVRPGSLSLSPEGYAGNNALVSARFTCETLSFKVPDALVSILGDVNADE